jgi:hypothetical protein
VFAIVAPSIGSTLIRSAPQRCEEPTMDPLIQVVNDNCNSPVCRALPTWVQRFSPTLSENSAGLNWLLVVFATAGGVLRALGSSLGIVMVSDRSSEVPRALPDADRTPSPRRHGSPAPRGSLSIALADDRTGAIGSSTALAVP